MAKKAFSAAPHNDRLMALRVICLRFFRYGSTEKIGCRLGHSTAGHLFRHILQKCSEIHQVFPAVFDAFDKKFADALTHNHYSVLSLPFLHWFALFPVSFTRAKFSGAASEKRLAFFVSIRYNKENVADRGDSQNG